MTTTRLLLAGSAMSMVLAVAALAASDFDDPPPPPALGGSLPGRPKLTGDWFGCRTDLQGYGLTFDVSTTQFYQGVAAGGLERAFRYGGRNDCFLNLDGEKLGLWQGLRVTLHAESRYGESANPLAGTLSPVNEMLVVPQPSGYVTALTAVKLTQYLSQNLLVYAGKINTFDDDRQPLTGASGLDGFLNTSLLFNPIDDRTVPYSTFGAGCVYSVNGEEVFGLAVFDTNDTPTVSGFDTFFDNGVTILGQLSLPTQLFGLPGHQGISGVYSSGRYTNVQPSSYLNPVEGLVVRTTSRTGSWFVAYNFDQAVYASPGDPARVWGVFGDFGIADDNPNPIR
jgi:porin